MKHWFLLLVYLFIGCVNFAIAQNSTINILNASTADTTFFNNDSTIYTIGEILLKGNKTTKSYTIYREVPFKQGDKLSAKQLTEHLVLAKNQIMNTSLFLDVTVYVSNIINNVATIQINVKERWYIFPLPYFKLADRNFSQWWYDHKASLNRVNYGLKFFHNNISGRNDKLTVNLITGYSQQVQLGYANPFLDKKLKHGFSVVLNYLRQKEMNYATINHKQVFVKSDDFIRESAMGLFTYSYRPDSKFRFLTTLGIYHLNIADTVLQLNPHYLPVNTKSNQLNYASLSATLQYFALDYIPFPKKGFMFSTTLYGRGLQQDVNMLQATVITTNAVSLDDNSFLQFHTNSTIKFGKSKSYFNQSLMGYNEMYLRGMEPYVIDGMAGFVSNNTFYHKLFDFNFKNPIKIKNYETIPFGFYAKLYGDIGYAYNQYATGNKALANILLSAAGIGLDITTIYDFVFRIEYGVNNVGDKVFGLRINGAF
jgi:outer membrane protein assembly factor BamA